MDPSSLALKARRLLAAITAALAVAASVPSLARAQAPDPCRLVVLGDSLTAGYGVPVGASFPARLGDALRERGIACEVVDAGVSGDTSAGGASRLGWVLADRPTHLLVELGGNDALRALPVDGLRRNLAAIIDRARGAGVEVMLAGMLPPPNLGRDYSDAFRDVYRDLAAKHRIPLYPFFLDGVVLETGLMQPDGIHPNERGVAEIVRRILPTVADWLQGRTETG